ncbi:MAG: zf-HC2 domain-containing protein, partial [Actinobacteria bacterium]|nr:zf-HC2 domain-containing protein [Actinomycetota bacterium]
MSGEMGCDQVRELVAELAIGIADGRERDAAMRHAATCPDCRQLVRELSAVVDDLLLLAPSHEPPPGFTAETVARIFPPSPGFTAETVARIFPPAAAQRRPAAPQRRRETWPAARHVLPNRRWLPRLAAAASIVAALALGAGAVYQGTSSDRQLAASY